MASSLDRLDFWDAAAFAAGLAFATRVDTGTGARLALALLLGLGAMTARRTLTPLRPEPERSGCGRDKERSWTIARPLLFGAGALLALSGVLTLVVVAVALADGRSVLLLALPPVLCASAAVLLRAAVERPTPSTKSRGPYRDAAPVIEDPSPAPPPIAVGRRSSLRRARLKTAFGALLIAVLLQQAWGSPAIAPAVRAHVRVFAQAP